MNLCCNHYVYVYTYSRTYRCYTVWKQSTLSRVALLYRSGKIRIFPWKIAVSQFSGDRLNFREKGLTFESLVHPSRRDVIALKIIQQLKSYPRGSEERKCEWEIVHKWIRYRKLQYNTIFIVCTRGSELLNFRITSTRCANLWKFIGLVAIPLFIFNRIRCTIFIQHLWFCCVISTPRVQRT